MTDDPTYCPTCTREWPKLGSTPSTSPSLADRLADYANLNTPQPFTGTQPTVPVPIHVLNEAVEALREHDRVLVMMAEEQTEIVGELKARITELEATERAYIANHLDMIANEHVPGSEDHVVLSKAVQLLRGDR